MNSKNNTSPSQPGLPVKRSSLVFVIALVTIVQGTTQVPLQGIPVLFPFVQQELGLSPVQLGLMGSALFAGGLITVVPAGWLSDIWGVRIIMAVSMAVLSVALLTLSVAWSFPVFLAFASLIGFAQAPGFPATSKAIIDWAPPRIRAMAMSIKQSGPPIVASTAALLLPIIATAWSWRAALVCLAGFVFVVGVVFTVSYRDRPVERRNVSGQGAGGLGYLLHDRTLVLAILWGVVFASTHVLVTVYFILFLVDVAKYSPVAAGGQLGIALLASAVGRLFWGAASDFLFGGRRVLVLGVIGVLTSTVFFGASRLGEGASVVFVALIAAAFGATLMAWPGVLISLVGETAAVGRSGVATGVLNMCMRLGTITAAPLFGLMLERGGSYSLGWTVVAGICITVTAVLLIFGREPAARQLASR
ncbi:MAG: putative arabinose efflux permease, MFS family [Chloroflexi bacterium]|jgi:sugar phosphate permease|nr:MAG: putative arabinose efflux permease, MFS family [Chloroflexota bacterium]